MWLISSLNPKPAPPTSLATIFIGRGGTFQVPPSWDEPQAFVYTFPGYPGYLLGQGGTTNPALAGRPAFPFNVQSRLQHDYYIVDPNGLVTGKKDAAGNPLNIVTSSDLIPIIQRTLYYVIGNTTLFIDPPSVVPVGGLNVGSTFYFETVPNQATYKTWVANATSLGWSSGRVGTADTSPGQLVAEMSVPMRLVGNIWMRTTRYVLAM